MIARILFIGEEISLQTVSKILKRVNKELKRHGRVIGAFPNERSLIRLAVAILIDMNEERLMGRRYLDMEESNL